MKKSWRTTWGMPALSRLPFALGWKLAAVVGHESPTQRRATEHFLVNRFREVFPAADETQCRRWARRHLAMLAQELLDAVALNRIGAPGGPSVELRGWEHVQELQNAGQGFILVLNHFDRLLVAPIALARRGLKLSNLTMPIFKNASLSASDREFLLRKIGLFTGLTGGHWRTTDQSLRPVIEGLRSGDVWIVLADAWQPHLSRLRAHPFLNGWLELPMGVARLAHAGGVPMLHAVTYTEHADELLVEVTTLSDNVRQAMDQIIAKLDHDVRARPWAWWHWGLWEQMWHASPPRFSAGS